jgi:hypothetical protein
VRPSRRLAALFLVALLGVLAAGGALVLRAGGGWALVGYAVVVLALLAFGAARARAALAPQRPEGRTCDCCTSSVHDPVRVI